LHECLLAARAYPDDQATFALAERALHTFAARSDVKRLHPRLTDTGIAGADIRFAFFAPTARRLAKLWPTRLEIDWANFESAPQDALTEWLPQLSHGSEWPGIDEYDYGLKGWLARLKGTHEADGAFVARGLSERLADDAVFERVHDGLGLSYVLRGDATTPSRTNARWPAPRTHFQRAAFAGRPELAVAANTPPRAIRTLSLAQGEAAVELAMRSMVTRTRDLDVFAWGDARDVRHIDMGDGLAFLMIGARPERRLLLESVYGFLTLKNGVPVGYVLTSALFGSAEIAFNVFDTFRGAEAGPVYGKVLGMTRALFGSDTFTIYPYQLGDHNDEAIESGAWWFYYKMGFRPRARTTKAVLARELARMARDKTYRSSATALRKLARSNLYASLDTERDDVIGELPTASAGIAATRWIAERFHGDRAAAAAHAEREAVAKLGLRSLAGWTADERAAFTRWAPLVCLLPNVTRWSAGERAAFAQVIRAKGSRREDAFARAFDAHPKLGTAIAKFVRGVRT
jgi:hypothetical protein